MGVRSGPKISTRGSEFELVTNGELAADSDWSKGTGWSIGSGKATCDGSQSSDSALTQDIPIIAGQTYKISFHFTRTAGDMDVRLGGNTSGSIAWSIFSAGGDHTFYSPGVAEFTLVADSSNLTFKLNGNSSFAGTFDNVSVKPVSSPLVLSLDAFNIKSYAGEVGTDVNLNTPVAGVHDYTGTTYASSNEWASDATKLTKTYDATIRTPLDDGYGATIISESGNAGYHHLSHMGGSGSGNHMISFYFKPITNDITDFRAGMLGDGSNGGCIFNFVAGTVTAVGGSSGKVIVFEKLSNGWWFCACDINGRVGGWVGSIGLSIHTSYTGTAGNKKGYICGLQYSNKSYPTAYGDRSDTDGWRDISGNGNHGTLTNMLGTGTTHFRNFNIMLPTENAYLDFDGSNDYINLGQATDGTGGLSLKGYASLSICQWVNLDSLSSYGRTFYENQTDAGNNYRVALGGDSSNFSFYLYTSSGGAGANKGSAIATGAWTHIAGTYDGANIRLYINGEEAGSASQTGTVESSTGSYGGIAIGARRSGSSLDQYVNGKIATTSVWISGLTHAQIKQIYNAQKSRFGL